MNGSFDVSEEGWELLADFEGEPLGGVSIIVCGEPTGSLLEHIREMVDDGTTVLYVSDAGEFIREQHISCFTLIPPAPEVIQRLSDCGLKKKPRHNWKHRQFI